MKHTRNSCSTLIDTDAYTPSLSNTQRDTHSRELHEKTRRRNIQFERTEAAALKTGRLKNWLKFGFSANFTNRDFDKIYEFSDKLAADGFEVTLKGPQKYNSR